MTDASFELTGLRDWRYVRGQSGVRTPEVCRRAGVTYRQLDYWRRIGIVKPSVQLGIGSGTQHLWSERDVELLLVARWLMKMNCPSDYVTKALEVLDDMLDGGRWAQYLAVSAEGLLGVLAGSHGALRSAARCFHQLSSTCSRDLAGSHGAAT